MRCSIKASAGNPVARGPLADQGIALEWEEVHGRGSCSGAANSHQNTMVPGNRPTLAHLRGSGQDKKYSHQETTLPTIIITPPEPARLQGSSQDKEKGKMDHNAPGMRARASNAQDNSQATR